MVVVIVILSIFIWIALSVAIAFFLGRKRHIGSRWSFFFCLFLTPIIGFVITMLSRKYQGSNPKPSILTKVFGWIIIALCVFPSINQVIYFANGGIEHALSVGGFGYLYGRTIVFILIGLGIYLIEIGSGKEFSAEY